MGFLHGPRCVARDSGQPQRGCMDVIKEIMGPAQAKVWVSDCHSAQLKAPAHQRQLCMSHQLRNLQAVIDTYPSLRWPKAMQGVFRRAIHLHHQRPQLPPDEFHLQATRLERVCDRLLRNPLEPPDAQRLQRRYLRHRLSLFVFLYHTDVEPTNNVAERALRHSVVHRKVTGWLTVCTAIRLDFTSMRTVWSHRSGPCSRTRRAVRCTAGSSTAS